jgi:5'-nucleotidase
VNPDGAARHERVPEAPRRPKILLTNDDGWDAPGLRALVGALADRCDLHVAAPRRQQSGVGHSITLRGNIDVEQTPLEGASSAHVVDGTPADCVKVGVRALMAEAPPDLVVSGLNDGPNVGVNVFYSGTVGAALEAAVNGVPAVAVSKEFGDGMSFGEAAHMAAPLIIAAAGRGLPRWHILNVNIPARPPASIAGVRLTHHGVSGFDERYREVPVGDGARGRRRFVLEGEMKVRDSAGLTDAEALAAGYVSVTPLGLDLTARTASPEPLEGWEWVLGCE